MKKQIENIFSKKKISSEKNKCPNSKIPIIIDTREKQSLITANLLEKKANIKLEKLEIGDYLIQDTIIERKTFSDFIGSMINKRLIEQLINLKKYPKHFLIIEGFDYNYDKFKVHENAVRGMLISIAIDFQVPTIFTKDEEDTTNFLILTARKYEKPITLNPIRQSKNFKTLEEQKQFILEGFPGIGPTTAKQLLEKFKTLKEIFNISEEQLEKISHFDDNKIKKFQNILNN
ncbi:hypothetical protein KAI32_04055 [Candidatus Pacearchaeota archaeon]|nr:hypothetical protein [Candidatus Pacearchaeota archaeon]